MRVPGLKITRLSGPEIIRGDASNWPFSINNGWLKNGVITLGAMV